MDNLGTLGDIPKDLCPAYKVRSFNFYLRFDKFLFIEFEFIHLVFFSYYKLHFVIDNSGPYAACSCAPKVVCRFYVGFPF